MIAVLFKVGLQHVDFGKSSYPSKKVGDANVSVVAHINSNKFMRLRKSSNVALELINT
jgi:hypothetical protein